MELVEKFYQDCTKSNTIAYVNSVLELMRATMPNKKKSSKKKPY